MSFEREYREQREQASNIEACERSHDDSMVRNCGNSFPLNLPTPIIERPCYMSHNHWFELHGKKMKPGVYWHGKRFKDGESVDVDEWICSPLTVDGITSSPKQDNFGRLLKFQDSNGQWHEWAMPMHLLKGNGDELRGELLNQGVIFNPKRRGDIINYLMTQQSQRKITAVDHVGWHEGVFVLPNQLIGHSDITFQSDVIIDCEFHKSGTLEGWQQEIGKLCVGNIPLMVSVCAALAGPLLKHVDRQQGGGIHWVGDSSSGKSTAVEIAASVWGSPDFIRSWSATANGLEGVAATRNDTCLILDEIDEASPHEIGKITYMLANGQGKQRAGKVGNARKVQRWRLITISTGERTINGIMNEIGKRPNAGQLVRLLSVPVTFEHGAFSNLHHFENGRALSDRLKMMRLKHYGHIGPAFIQRLIEDKRDFAALYSQAVQSFAKRASSNLEKRAAAVFALLGLAGEIGIEYGLLPWDPGCSLEGSLKAYLRWQAYLGPSHNEDSQILQAISDFIAKHGDSRFSELHDRYETTIHNRAGWYKNMDQGRVFMFFPVALMEAGGGFERTRIVEALKRANWIVESDVGRATKKVRIRGGLNNLYCICEPGQTGSLS